MWKSIDLISNLIQRFMFFLDWALSHSSSQGKLNLAQVLPGPSFLPSLHSILNYIHLLIDFFNLSEAADWFKNNVCWQQSWGGINWGTLFLSCNAECQITITKAHLSSSSSFIIEVHMYTGEVSWRVCSLTVSVDMGGSSVLLICCWHCSWPWNS